MPHKKYTFPEREDNSIFFVDFVKFPPSFIKWRYTCTRKNLYMCVHTLDIDLKDLSMYASIIGNILIVDL